MMNTLKRDLTENGVQFTETLFSTADGISGLGEEPFVRMFINCLHLTMNILVHRKKEEEYLFGQCTALMPKNLLVR